jgi:hypothetical protein
MDFPDLLRWLYESLYFLVVFGICLVIAIAKGRQALITLIIALFLALLLAREFPYYGAIDAVSGDLMNAAVAKVIVFVILTIGTWWLCARIMPSEFRETKFESFGKKIVLALTATCLIMVFSVTVLAIDTLVETGTPLQLLFGNEQWLFWWLVSPLIVLFLLG